ncbi:MAG TPA: beta-ketoacyl-ACP synthase II [Firmicutes bacterium]|nr:beta-ketoacyl-ACP synthase II [Bacillota bacterium]
MKRRVVITGLGAITPCGIGVDTFWAAMKTGKSGVGPITQFDAGRLSTRFAAEVKGFDPTEYMEHKEARRTARFAQFAVAAARMALDDARIDLEQVDRDRLGVIIGSGIGGIDTFEAQCRLLIEKGPQRVSPFFVPMMIPDMAAGQVAIACGLRGHNTCTVTACASGTNSIGDAYRVIQYGMADGMIAGGSEAAIGELPMAGFCSARALSTLNEAPEKASRPFDRTRDGFVMGEGAGILFLEELEHAKRRGARIYAEIIGYGASGDAYHITDPAPNGAGAARAMRLALKDADIEPEQVGYINAHGTSTIKNDYYETLAVKSVFGAHAEKVAISSTKSMTGHLLGAAGGVEAVICVKALETGILPPTINYEQPDPDCDLDYIPNAARERQVDVVMSNSFGFGGHNGVIVLRRYVAD